VKAKMVTTRHVTTRVFIEWTLTIDKKGGGLEDVHQRQKLTTHENTLLVQKYKNMKNTKKKTRITKACPKRWSRVYIVPRRE
jgi:hypothetical protein